MSDTSKTQATTKTLVTHNKKLCDFTKKPTKSAVRKMLQHLELANIDGKVKKDLIYRGLDLEQEEERNQLIQAHIAGFVECLAMIHEAGNTPNGIESIQNLQTKDLIYKAEQFYLKKYDV